jgi:magnesium transporter
MDDKFTLISYGPDVLDHQSGSHLEEILSQVQKERVSWLIVRGFRAGDQDEIEKLLSFFSAGPAFAENIVNQTPLAFSDQVPGCLFFEYRVPAMLPDQSQDTLLEDRGNIILGDGYLLLFDKKGAGFFDEIQQELLNGKTQAQNFGIDYLLYLLMIAAIFQMNQLISIDLHVRFEELEDDIFANRGKKLSLENLLDNREYVKALYEPLARMDFFLGSIREDDGRFITSQTRHLFTKNLVADLDALERGYDRLTDWVSELIQLHQTYVNERTNYLLQILSTIFLPLSFLTGLFGMNFANMPGLDHPYGYFAALLLMAAIVVGMLVLLKSRGLL